MATTGWTMLAEHRRSDLLSRPRRARFVFPELGEAAGAGQPAPADPPPAAGSPPDGCLVFGEDEIARAMAWSAAEAGAAARDAAADAAEEALRRAAGGLAAEVPALQRARDEAADRVRLEVRRLFGAFAEACLDRIAGTALAEAMNRAVERILAEIAPPTEVVVEVAPALADRVAAALAADGSPGQGRCIVRGQAALALGDVAVTWRDGWAEWSLDRLRQALAMQLDEPATDAGEPGGPPPANDQPALTQPSPGATA
jgi:hypothetical protein